MAERRPRRRWPWVLGVVLGLPVGAVALLALQAWLATQREYVTDVDFAVTGRVEAGAPEAEPLRVAVLGDSTVAGLGSPSVDETLPVLLAERVAPLVGRPVEVRGFGVSGARTTTVADEQAPLLAGGEWDVVVVVIGSNDVTHLTTPRQMTERTRRMLRVTAATGDAPVVLGGIPLFGGATNLDQPLRAAVDRYASVLRRRQALAAAEIRSAVHVDIASLASPRFVGVPDAMSADEFHPGPVGYGFWADALAPVVAQVATTATR